MDLRRIKRTETHSHSCISNIRLIDSINDPKDLILKAAELGLSGIALTDHECVSGAVDFLHYEKDLKKSGKIPEDFKCILGNEIYLTDKRKKSQRYYHFILLAKNNDGHEAIRELSSMAWYRSYYDRRLQRVPTLKKELKDVMSRYKGTVIATTACLGGELPYYVLNLVDAERKQDTNLINQCKKSIYDFLTFCIDVFGEDFYIEIAPSKSKDQIKFNRRIVDIAKAFNIKMIFATDAHFLTSEMREIHKAYLNSKDGEREVDDFYYYAHLMDNNEAYENLKDIYSLEQFKEFCNNSMEIYDKIEGYNLFREQIIPIEEVKQYAKKPIKGYDFLNRMSMSDSDQDRYWVNECLNTLREKDLFNKEYLERLETEAEIILFTSDKLKQPLSAYFNTLQHYINLFWECGSIVGPGRGSAVGFLSDYLLGITQVDPIKWDLPYWRFLNKERVEMPDIDIDLAPSKRAKIFKKIRETKGELRLLQVCTFGTEGTRSAILTACRGYRGQLINGKYEYPNGIDVDIAQYMTGLIPVHRGFLWPLKDVINGNEEEDRKPIKSFINEVQKYPGLLDIMLSIEGLVNKRSQHASGVILYNQDPWKTNAVMRSPSGDLTTQFALHQSEDVGDIKYDFLLTEASDKIINCIDLLKKDGYFEEEQSLRDIYNSVLHPEKIDYNDKRIWDALSTGSVMDIFQFNSDVGLIAAKTIKPANPLEMTAANALMRLMGEKGKETPLERYTRMKNNINDWYKEMYDRGLDDNDINIIEPYYKSMYGTPCFQEDLMRIVMDEHLSHFTLKESNQARKTVAKKKFDEIPALENKFINQCENKNLARYVWDTSIAPQLGYSFSLLHSLAYSFVGIQMIILSINYPSIYWNCACLITNSGGNEEEEDEEDIIETCAEERDEEDEDEDEEDIITVKKRVRNTNYGKISTAIGTMQKRGINVSVPDINKSSYTFTPDLDTNSIIYGINGINKIGQDLVNDIINNRPYENIDDLLSKVKINKTQAISLIKSGAFDNLYKMNREDILKKFIFKITDKKKRLTLQNMQQLINFNLIPDEYSHEIKVYNFNKYLKKTKDDSYYYLDDIAFKFYENNYDVDLLDFINNEFICKIEKKSWDKIYKKEMDVLRDYLKEKQVGILFKLNCELFSENWNKYCQGNISKWEMDSISFYYHEHELENIDEDKYGIVNFFDLSEEPQIDKIINIKGKQIPLMKLYRIAGTVLDKNKNKNSISLLTKYGVVSVKIYQSQFSKYDRQLSIKLPTGKKKVVEKSWFSRGNKLVITGIRRGDNFVPKVYKSTNHVPIELIYDVKGTEIYTLEERANVE